MKKFTLILFLAFFILGIKDTQAQTRQADSLALVSFYDSCCNTGCTLNWDFSKPLDSLAGVTMYMDRVVYLYCSNKNLTGNIHNLNLTALIDIYLNNNQFSGSIPNFSNLAKVRRLFLYNNQLSGSIPNLSNSPDLTVLYLANNQLTGSIPNFSNLPILDQLYINGNQLSGSIPDFSNLPALTTLWAHKNQLSGSIPDFSNLPILDRLYLHDNQLTGSIPNFSNLPDLTEIYLRINQLTGSIPDFSNLPILEQLYLEQNQFTFEDFLPSYDSLTQGLNHPVFSYYNQDSIGTTQAIYLTAGDTHTIDLVIDDTVSTNTYYWYKDGVLIDSTFGINEYTISNFQGADIGTYTAKIINRIITKPAIFAHNLVLHSRPILLTISTSTKKLQIEQLQVAPNPVQDMLYINTAAITGAYQVEVINIQGQIIETLQGNGNTSFMLPMAAKPAGVYIVRMTQEDKVWQQKVIKQ